MLNRPLETHSFFRFFLTPQNFTNFLLKRPPSLILVIPFSTYLQEAFSPSHITHHQPTASVSTPPPPNSKDSTNTAAHVHSRITPYDMCLRSSSPPLSPSSPTHKRQRTDVSDKCPPIPSDMSLHNTDLQQRVRQVIAAETSPSARQQRIAQVFAEARQRHVAKRPSTAHRSTFPGKGAPQGCDHYQRNCWIRAHCCQRYYPCRRCHDRHEDHEIDRHATQYVGCVVCGDADQPVSNKCRSCGVQFARYFCAICKFYDNTPEREAYHCDGCGICRVGKGLGIDNYHCDGCNNCVPIEAKEQHPCRERSLDANCPICTHYLATSTEPVVFMRCGHTIHVDCLMQHTATGYTCPICNKCLTDMKEWYKALDERIARDVIPPEFANRVSRVLCHDCDEKTVVPFHFVYHKCDNCGGYNTRILEQFDRQTGASEAGVDSPLSEAREAPVEGAART